ncbi:nucleolar and spindle-associated protein 1 isoform X2 [Hydra vulgaris]|uniref:nucleolar and spindle-associated protein 1 isoform X2 n=1 Tax=Hydra vulgaris TaxID=6087 RepID=UPI001F5EB185|nr:nucleolar and spindle-associated protein 1-like isoform X2 [Hydra vulgaris]
MYTKEELELFSYRQLQKLCKQLNLKANKKSSDLLDDLFQIFAQSGESNKILQENVEVSHEKSLKLLEAKDQPVEVMLHNTAEVMLPNSTEVMLPISTELLPNSAEVILPNSAEVMLPNSVEGIIPDAVDVIISDIEMDKENIKAEIANEIDKRAEIKVSKIPRAKDFNKSEVLQNSNFSECVQLKSPGRFLNQHKAQFKKMDSLDVYMEKKRQRADMILNKSVGTKLGVSNAVTPAKNVLRSSPRLNRERSDERNVALHKGRKSVHFTSAIKDTKSCLNATIGDMRSPSLKKTPIKFDLQASLEKGLTYKPHSGKLKQSYFQVNRLPPKSLDTSSVELNKKSIKEIRKEPRSRNDRRIEMIKGRENKRNSAIAKKRKMDI